MLQPRGQLLLGEHAVRRRLAARAELAVRGDVLIERHLIRAVTPPPEPVPVARLVDGDAVDPGAEARLAAESVNGAEDAEEDFLRQVQRFVAIAEQVHGQLDDHPLVLGHELGAGRFLAGGAALDERRLTAAYVATNWQRAPVSRRSPLYQVRPRPWPRVPPGLLG